MSQKTVLYMLGLILMIGFTRLMESALMNWFGLSYSTAFFISFAIGLLILVLFGRWYGQREAAKSTESSEPPENEE